MQMQAMSLEGQARIKGDAQSDIILTTDESLAVVTHDADWAQVVLPQENINLFDGGLVFGSAVRELTIIAQAQGVTIGQDGTALLRDTVDALFDLKEDGRFFGQRFICLVAADAQLAAEAQTVFLFPVTAQVG